MYKLKILIILKTSVNLKMLIDFNFTIIKYKYLQILYYFIQIIE